MKNYGQGSQIEILHVEKGQFNSEIQDFPYGFTLKTNVKDLNLFAASSEEMEFWVMELQQWQTIQIGTNIQNDYN